MDNQQAAPDEIEGAPAGFDPNHYFATPSSRVDLATVKPHTCMQNVKQIGNYVHCYDGQHGMRLAHDEILVKKADGTFIIEKINIVTTDKKGAIVADLSVKRKRAKL